MWTNFIRPLVLWSIPLVILSIAIWDALHRLKMLRRADLIRRLSFIVRQNLPLIATLNHMVHGEPGSVRHPFRYLSRILETGLPLSDAIRKIWPTCPRADYSILCAAENSGTLPDALANMEVRYNRELDARYIGDHRVNGLAYLSLFFVVVTYWFVNIFSAPRFLTITEDFDVGTRNSFHNEILANHFWSYHPPTTWFGIVFHTILSVVIFGIPLWIVGGWLLRSLRGFSFVRDVLDGVSWLLPVTRRVAVAEGCVLSLPTARLALVAGWPLDRAIDLAASVQANAFWRHKLGLWRDQIRSGHDALTAGRLVRLPETLIRYLAVGVRDGNLDAPLYAAEQYFANLLERHRRVVRTTVWFVATLTAGFIVGCISVAIIMMIRDVIDGVILTWYDT